MAGYESDLLGIAVELLEPPEDSGVSAEARVRRSISTSYYALFHFLVNEACSRLVGAGGIQRRRILGRSFTHSGIRTALGKVRGANIDPSIHEFMQGPGGPVPPPAFAQALAAVFVAVEGARNDADYDLNKMLSVTDAHLAAVRVRLAIEAWRDALSVEDEDFKASLGLLMLLKGQLRRES